MYCSVFKVAYVAQMNVHHLHNMYIIKTKEMGIQGFVCRRPSSVLIQKEFFNGLLFYGLHDFFIFFILAGIVENYGSFSF